MKPEVKRQYLAKKWFISVGVTLFTLLTIINIALSSRVSNEGNRLNELEARALELKLQNQLLEQDLVRSRSLTMIEPKASEMGFDNRPISLVISVDEAVAQLIQPN